MDHNIAPNYVNTLDSQLATNYLTVKFITITRSIIHANLSEMAQNNVLSFFWSKTYD